MIDNLEYFPGLGKSDHVCLHFNYKCYTDLEVSTTTKQQLNFHKGNCNSISTEIDSIQWEQDMDNKDVAEAWESFAEKTIKFY